MKWGAAQLKWVIFQKQIYVSIYLSMDVYICMDSILVHKCIDIWIWIYMHTDLVGF